MDVASSNALPKCLEYRFHHVVSILTIMNDDMKCDSCLKCEFPQKLMHELVRRSYLLAAKGIPHGIQNADGCSHQ